MSDVRRSSANSEPIVEGYLGLDTGTANGESGEGEGGRPKGGRPDFEDDSPSQDMFFEDLDDARTAPWRPGMWNRILIFGEDHCQLIYYIPGTTIETAHAWYDLDTGQLLTSYELLH